MLRWLACLVLALLTCAAGLPVLVAALSLSTEPSVGVPERVFEPWRILRTGVIAGVIGLLATTIAWPVALATRGRAWSHVFVLLPLLVPVYLIPGAWRTLLDPSSSIGAWLLRESIGGWNYVRWVDQALSVVGLAIWVSPIAWIVLHLRVVSLGGIRESLELECPSRAGLHVALLRVSRGAIVRSIGFVGLVMLGHTIAFDLAMIETISNATRVSVSLGRMREAWLIALPVLCVAVCASAWFAFRSARWRAPVANERPSKTRGGSGRRAVFVVLLPVLLGVILPTLLLSGTLRDTSAIERFVRRSAGAIAWTSGQATIVGLLACGLGLAMTVVLREFARVAHGCAGIFAMLALVPGVLFGGAVARAFSSEAIPSMLADSSVALHSAHLGRFGIVMCLGAIWLRAIEPREFDDLARLRVASLRAWIWADAPRHVPAIVGVSLMVAAMSIHEIEAAVLLQPVGSDALARFMLELLHYQRRDDLSAGVLILSGLSLGIGFGGAFLVFAVRNPNRTRPRLLL